MTRRTKIYLRWAGLLIILFGIAAGWHFYRLSHSPDQWCADAQKMAKQGNYNAALDYYRIAEKILRSKSDHSDKLAELYMKLGGLYFTVNKNDHAMICYENAEKIWSSTHSPKIIQVYSNFATIYLEKHQLMQARAYYFRALREIKKRNAVQQTGYHNLARIYYYLAETCFELNSSTEAEFYFFESLKAMTQAGEFVGRTKLESRACQRLSELFCRNKNDFRPSLFGLKPVSLSLEEKVSIPLRRD